MIPLPRRRLLAAFTGLAVTLAACGGDDPTPPQAAAGDLPAFKDGDDGDDPAVGMRAPAISGADYDGEPAAFEPGENGPTLLVFLAHWCGHCNAEIPTMIEWEAAGSVPENLDIVGISTGASASRDNYPPGRWLDDSSWPWPVIADDEEEYRFAGRYGLTATPYLVLVDADGEVVARAAGQKSAAELSQFVSPITR